LVEVRLSQPTAWLVDKKGGIGASGTTGGVVGGAKGHGFSRYLLLRALQLVFGLLGIFCVVSSPNPCLPWFREALGICSLACAKL
jgi:hypothetical protein